MSLSIKHFVYHFINHLTKYRYVRLIVSILMVSFFSNLAFGINLPQTEAVPGGVVVVNLGISSNSTDNKAPVVFYNKQRIMVAANNGAWHGIIGIPLAASPGKHTLTIKGQSKTIQFTVKSKEYAEQHLTIKDKRKVNPTAEDLKRIRRERVKINKALKHWAESEIVDTNFTLPVDGELSSPFGLKRYFNEQPRKPHSGVDIAAPEGTPITAPASGRIIESGEFFFNGNSVFIDHGQGLVTMYCHMSRINVKPGQLVNKGDIIGAVGQTGRVTGPHLHWSVSLNNARVDPGLFVEHFYSLANSNKKM